MYQIKQRGISGLTYQQHLGEYLDANDLVIEMSAILFDSEIDLALDCYKFSHPYLTREECIKENRRMLAKALWDARKLGWRYKKIKNDNLVKMRYS